MKRPLVLCACCVIILLSFGFGCKKSPPPVQNADYLNDITSLKTLATRPPLVIETVQTTSQNETSSTSPLNAELATLRSAIARLGKVNTFRATLSVPTPNGIVTGSVEYVRAIGMHGLLNLSDGVRSEVFLTETKVLFRTNTKSAWSDLTGTEDGKQVAALFKNSFSMGNDGEQIFIPSGAFIVGVGNDPSGCRLYIYTQPDQQGRTQICVREGLPVRLASETAHGIVEVRYSDFNKFIQLQVPAGGSVSK